MNERSVRLLREELARHTYKPGYRMQITETGMGLRFELGLTTADSYHPDRDIRLRFTATVPEFLVLTQSGAMDPDLFTRWLGATLREFEMHEAAEWHRRGGELVTDPHAERTFGRPV